MTKKIIILGMPSITKDIGYINKSDSKEIFVTDGISYTILQGKTNKKLSEILFDKLFNKFDSLYLKSNFSNERKKIEIISKEFFLDKNNLLTNLLEFFISYNLIELLRVKEFLVKENVQDITLITSEEYLKILKNLFGEIKVNKLIVRQPSFLDFIFYLMKSRLTSFFGRLNFLRYSIGFTIISLFKSLQKENLKEAILVSNNKYSIDAAKFLYPKTNFQSLDPLWKVSIPFYFKNYRKAFKINSDQIIKDKGLKDILKVTPFLYFSIKYLYGPYLQCMKFKLEKLFNNKTITTIIQHSDASPHRRLIALEGNKRNIKTIVTNHGYLAEPLIITDISSKLLCTYSKGYSYYADYNKFSNHLQTINIKYKKQKLVREYAKEENNNLIYVLTNGYGGYSLRNSLQNNFELIEEVIYEAKKFNIEKNIIIKIHPSESISLYKNYFKTISVIKNPLEKISNKIKRAVITTTSALFYLKPECKFYYYCAGERPYDYPKNKYNLKQIIQDSIF